jgi:hypothetical protein
MEFCSGRGGAWTLAVKEDDQKEEGGQLDIIRGVKTLKIFINLPLVTVQLLQNWLKYIISVKQTLCSLLCTVSTSFIFKV